MSCALVYPAFKQGEETWDSYVKRFEYFLDANDLADISNSKKKSFFLSLCGSDVFDTATALLAPRAVKSVPWTELQEALGNHYSPKPSRVARRYAFRQRVQAEGETINQFMTALRIAALHCGFRDYLEDMLLDQLVWGVRDIHLQQRLLAKGDLTLTTAVEEAIVAELATISSSSPASGGQFTSSWCHRA